MAYKDFWSKRTGEIRASGWSGIKDLLSYIPQWGYFIPGIILVTPLVIIIRVIRPFIFIRFGNLNSGRIGHFAFDTSMYLAERELGDQPNNSVDLFSYGRVPCNEQFAVLCERKLLMSFSWVIKGQIHSFYRYLWMCNEIIPFGSKHTIELNTSKGSVDLTGNLAKTKPHFSFNEIENDRANKFLSEIGFKDGDKFICYIVRDSQYLTKISSTGFSHHDYRDSDIDTYNDSAMYLAEKGYWVLRMGKVVYKPFNVDHPRILDYANSPYRSDFLDIWLMAHCYFCVTTGTGLDDVSVAFRRPIVEVNYLPIGLNRCNQVPCIHLGKHLRWKTNGKFISLNDQIKIGAIDFLHTDSYKDLGVEILDNTAEEILNAIIEMDERLNGTWIDELEDLELQNIFWEKFKDSSQFNERFGWVHPDSRISTSFLRKNYNWFLS